MDTRSKLLAPSFSCGYLKPLKTQVIRFRKLEVHCALLLKFLVKNANSPNLCLTFLYLEILHIFSVNSNSKNTEYNKNPFEIRLRE